MNAEEGKKDVCGQKHERKNTISFFILRSGGRIYFLACTADTPFLWVSFPYVSCQAGVLMKQNDTGSLSLTLLHSPNTLVSASQERFSQPLLSPFFPRTRSDMWDPVWFKLGESAVYLTPMGWLPAAANSGIVCPVSWVYTLNPSSNRKDLESKNYFPWKRGLGCWHFKVFKKWR